MKHASICHLLLPCFLAIIWGAGCAMSGPRLGHELAKVPTPAGAIEQAREMAEEDPEALNEPARDAYDAHNSVTVLIGAIAGEHVDLVELMLEAGADPNLTDADGQSPLSWAMASNASRRLEPEDLQITLLLVEAGADLDRKLRTSKMRPLDTLLDAAHSPLADEFYELATVMVEHGAPLGPTDQERCRRAPLHTATERAQTLEHVAVVEKMLAAGADPNAQMRGWDRNCGAERGHRPLTLAVELTIYDSSMEVKDEATLAVRKALVEVLLRHGAAPSAAGPRGRTALHFAVERCAPEVTRLLLDSGADPSAEDSDGRLPLDVSTWSVDPQGAACQKNRRLLAAAGGKHGDRAEIERRSADNREHRRKMVEQHEERDQEEWEAQKRRAREARRAQERRWERERRERKERSSWGEALGKAVQESAREQQRQQQEYNLELQSSTQIDADTSVDEEPDAEKGGCEGANAAMTDQCEACYVVRPDCGKQCSSHWPTAKSVGPNRDMEAYRRQRDAFDGCVEDCMVAKGCPRTRSTDDSRTGKTMDQ